MAKRGWMLTAGLWEQDIKLSSVGDHFFEEVYDIAKEQTVTGLIAAGIEHVVDLRPPKNIALSISCDIIQLENHNRSMNVFVERLIGELRRKNIYALLVKGQGIAQVYERPYWRACGDIDLLLSESNYKSAFKELAHKAVRIDDEDKFNKHIALEIDSWEVELHGTLRSNLWRKLDDGIDDVLKSVFYEGKVRSWMNGNTQVFLPNADEDVVLVFAHILQHLFKGGIGFRQICDWCRLLWTYKEKINQNLLMKRLVKMSVMTEWKVFASLAVNGLGIPADAMPFYSIDNKWKRKANKLTGIIFMTGNMGNRFDRSYLQGRSIIKRKLNTAWKNTLYCFSLAKVFPFDSFKAWCNMLKLGLNTLSTE